MHHILCESPFISRDFYAIQPHHLMTYFGVIVLANMGCGGLSYCFHLDFQWGPDPHLGALDKCLLIACQEVHVELPNMGHLTCFRVLLACAWLKGEHAWAEQKQVPCSVCFPPLCRKAFSASDDPRCLVWALSAQSAAIDLSAFAISCTPYRIQSPSEPQNPPQNTPRSPKPRYGKL